MSNSDLQFQKRKIVNFDSIKNDLDKKKLQQNQTIDHDEIKNYPPDFQDQIRSCIFRNSTPSYMNIQKEKIKEHFTNEKVPTGRGQFLKKIKDGMYAKYWWLFFVNFLIDKKVKCLKILMVQFFIFLVQ